MLFRLSAAPCHKLLHCLQSSASLLISVCCASCMVYADFAIADGQSCQPAAAAAQSHRRMVLTHSMIICRSTPTRAAPCRNHLQARVPEAPWEHTATQWRGDV